MYRGILTESISYYITNNSNVFCTFLDASKAFYRVHYCKLFRLVLQRGLPACIVRVLINLYVGHVIRVLLSSPFNAVNRVKQGGVLVSPVLFCIYIDGLLTKLSESGVGCYMGEDFLGALAYADNIVLIVPSPSAMRKLLAICDGYASDYDIIFNADKSKSIVFVSTPNRHFLVKAMNSCFFILVVI